MSLLYKIILGLGLAGALWAGWLYHDHVEQADGEKKVLAADQAAAARQKGIDDAKIAQAESAYTKELEDIKNAYLAPIPVGASVVCHSSSSGVPASNVHSGSSPAPAVVQTDPGLHPDITGTLYLLAERADTLAAQARELNAETH